MPDLNFCINSCTFTSGSGGLFVRKWENLRFRVGVNRVSRVRAGISVRVRDICRYFAAYRPLH